MYTLMTGTEFVTLNGNYNEINKIPKKFYNTLEQAQELALKISNDSANEIQQLKAELPGLKVEVDNAKKCIAKYREQLKDKDNLTIEEQKNIEKYLSIAEGEVFFSRLKGKSHPRTTDKLEKLLGVKVMKVTFEVPVKT